MELIDKQTVLNKERFEPMMRITVDISKNYMMDVRAKHGLDGAADILGKEFAEILKENN
jgi:hypothetical protein